MSCVSFGGYDGQGGIEASERYEDAQVPDGRKNAATAIKNCERAGLQSNPTRAAS